jgi:hypothetical protein
MASTYLRMKFLVQWQNIIFGFYSNYPYTPDLPRAGRPGRWLHREDYLEMCRTGYHVPAPTIDDMLHHAELCMPNGSRGHVYIVQVRGNRLAKVPGNLNKECWEQMRFICRVNAKPIKGPITRDRIRRWRDDGMAKARRVLARERTRRKADG